MNTHWLFLFYMVVKEGSITKASEVLHLSQPAISMQIKKLESTYGAKLLKRVGREVECTELGVLVYHQLKPVYEAILPNVEASLRNQRRIRIVGNAVIVYGFLPEHTAYHGGTEDLVVEIKVMGSKEAMQALDVGACDLVCISDIQHVEQDSRYQVAQLFEDDIVLFSKEPITQPLTHFVYPDYAGTLNRLIEDTHPEYRDGTLLKVASMQDMVATCNVNPQFTGIASRRFLDTHKSTFHTVPIGKRNTYYCVYRKDAVQQSLIQDYVDFLTQ